MENHNLQNATILIVDDNPQNLSVLSEDLTSAGFTTLLKKNGKSALELVSRKLPDLILLDVMMPRMDGFEVCRRLKSNDRTKDIPVIFITALDEIDSKVKGLEIGGVDYITKPFQRKEVLSRITTHLTMSRLRHALQQERDRFQGLSEATFEGIYIHEKGRILDVNQALITLTGYQRDELIGMNALELLAPEYRDEASRRMQSQNELYEAQGITRAGKRIPIEIQGRTITWQGHPARVVAVRDISWRKTLEQENLAFRASLTERDRFGELVGRSPSMQKVYERIAKAATSDETVIIYGETGTGKELAARMIFQLSEHHTKIFVPVNCGAMQETLFESHFFGYRKGAFTGALRDTSGYLDQAQGGTLFLDEVAELSFTMQAKLLRVLNDQTYMPVGSTLAKTADVRIIAATNQELRKLVAEAKIREDFFHRLHVITLDMPPLRQHKEDIPLLIKYFSEQRTPPGAPLPVIPPDILERLYDYDWPGNVRELFNELRRYLITGELELSNPIAEKTIEIGEAPFLKEGLTLSEAMNAFEHFYITRLLQRHQGQRSQTAEALGIDRRTLYSKLKKYDELE